MNIDLQNLPESLELSHKMIVDLHASLTEFASYKEKYSRLLEELMLAKQQRFAPASEKNILQPDFFDEPGVEIPKEEAQVKNDIEVKSHTRKKHPIRVALPKELPREIILHDLSDEEKICECGCHLTHIGEVISEQLKYIPASLSVVQHLRPKYACKPCQGNVKIAAMPVLLLPKSIATPELVAQTIVAKYCDHTPLYRQESIWKRLEIDMPRSTLCQWVLKVAELCEPLIKLLRLNILDYDYVQADETTVQVLAEKGRSNTAKSYMWVYKGGGKQNPTIIYDYQETRGGYHAESFLTGFKGYLQTDAYAGYNWADKNDHIISVGCMAHCRRPFAELAKLSKKTGLAIEAIKYFQKLYAIESHARENNFTPEERYAIRCEKSKIILDEFKSWCETNLTKVPKQHKLGLAIQYALRHWNELTNYLKDGGIEIDNNSCKNAIRPFAFVKLMKTIKNYCHSLLISNLIFGMQIPIRLRTRRIFKSQIRS
ncbi:MAG: IS66 family transposase [Gammaproteobacteria bacterium]|nr:IS66 family transposase [Gammaproteobacteria bacterium]